jgi:D-alanyl-D-alanine carboxypeptidase
VVTLDYGLSKEYAPQDLVPIGDVLPHAVTLGYPTEVRQQVLKPLVRMIEDMQAEGLRPQIQSGFRGYIAQALAWEKWNRLYPEHAAIISAPPGHSEHQLGTVVDFGSPELAGLVGEPGIEFHTDFAKTSEGLWLAEHAHEYGFTLSYTLDAFEISCFYYEPWHFRYVGREMAAQLRELGQTFTEYQLEHEPAPCIP